MTLTPSPTALFPECICIRYRQILPIYLFINR